VILRNTEYAINLLLTTERLDCWYNLAKSVVFCCLEVEGEGLVIGDFIWIGVFGRLPDGE
jgi:hypothetical protein